MGARIGLGRRLVLDRSALGQDERDAPALEGVDVFLLHRDLRGNQEVLVVDEDIVAETSACLDLIQGDSLLHVSSIDFTKAKTLATIS